MKLFLNVASNISISEESPNGFISCREERFMNHCFHAKCFVPLTGAINCSSWVLFFFFVTKFDSGVKPFITSIGEKSFKKTPKCAVGGEESLMPESLCP